MIYVRHTSKGEDNVLKDVLRVLKNPNDNALVLYGQRRIGKTSIVQELTHRLPQEGSNRC